MVVLLAMLAPNLPEPLKTKALEEVRGKLNTISEQIMRKESPFYYYGANLEVAKLAPHFVEPFKDKLLAVGIVLSTRDGELDDERNEPLSTLVRCSNKQVIHTVLYSMSSNSMRSYLGPKSSLISTVAKFRPDLLDDLMVQEALQMVIHDISRIPNIWSRTKYLAKLIPCLPESDKNDVLNKLFEDMLNSHPGDQEVALTLLAPHLAEDSLYRALNIALDIARKESSEGFYDDHWTNILKTLAPYVSQSSRSRLTPVWQELLHMLAERKRRWKIFQNLSGLIPLLVKLGDKPILVNIANATRDIVTRWP
jgi:hypothetical protein